MKTQFTELRYKGKKIKFGEPVKTNIVYFNKLNPPRIDMRIIGLMRKMANAIEGKVGFDFWSGLRKKSK